MDKKTKKEKTEIKDESKKGKKLRDSKLLKWFYKLLKIVLLIAIVIGTFIIGVKYSDSFMHKGYSQEIGFKDVGELVTQTAYIRRLEDSKNDRKLFEDSILPTIKVPFTESRLIFSYIIQVDAAINFKEINVKKIDEENRIIYLELPHARIIKSTPDVNSFQLHLDDESLFSRINGEERNELLKKMTMEAEEEAKANGIIENADNNGKDLIENFIKGIERYKDYNIEYEYVKGE